MTITGRFDNVFGSVVAALFVLFFGFRGFVGWDWVNYYPAYQEIVPLF